MQHSNLPLFLANTKDVTVGVRMDQILSFTYREPEMTLSIRYIGNSVADTYEGPVAEALSRELRYGGRR
jgi:hypothetical protein